jgi:chemotaxis protein MotA
MFQIIGIILLFGMVFGSFAISGGKLGVVLAAAPYELMAIGGAGAAAFLISNSIHTVKATGPALGKVFKGPRWTAQDYRDLLSLLFVLTKTMKLKGVIALESHIETPAESPIFSRYPALLKDAFATHFICDTLRVMTMNLADPHQVEDAMESQIDKHSHEALAPARAMSSLGDALPALGIVAAVLGVIKAMGAITAPPQVLGMMIGGALVGTFLGVFLAYGLVRPMAERMRDVAEEEAAFYRIIQAVLVAHLHGNAAQISVEIGRGSVPTAAQPSFLSLEATIDAIGGEG